MTSARMPIAELRPRNIWTQGRTVWDSWGDTGDLEAAGDETPEHYYAELLAHMGVGGSVPPIEVGYWTVRDDGFVYVFNGHHRLACAERLGHTHIRVTNSDDAEALPVLMEGATA